MSRERDRLRKSAPDWRDDRTCQWLNERGMLNTERAFAEDWAADADRSMSHSLARGHFRDHVYESLENEYHQPTLPRIRR